MPKPLIFNQFGGLELDLDPTESALKGEDGQILTARQADNVYIDQDSLEVRKEPGSVAWNSAAASEPIIRAFEYAGLDGERVMIIRTASGYYKSNPARSSWSGGGATTEMLSTFNESSQIPSYTQIGPWLLIVDGQNNLYWNGTDDQFTRWGSVGSTRWDEGPRAGMVGAASSATESRPRLATATGGSMAVGAYRVFFVFADNTHSTLTNQSPPSAVMGIQVQDATNDRIEVHTGYAQTGSSPADGALGGGYGLNVIPNGVTHIVAYVTQPNNPKGFFPAANRTVHYGGGGAVGTEVVVLIDSATYTTTAVTFGGPPAGVTAIEAFGERAFVTGAPGFPDRVWYCDAGNPHGWQDHRWLQVGTVDDPVVGLKTLPLETPVLAIFKRNSLWKLTGYDDNTFLTGLRMVSEGPGCLAPNAIMRVNKDVYWWGSGGFYRWDGVSEPQRIDRGIYAELSNAIRNETVPTG